MRKHKDGMTGKECYEQAIKTTAFSIGEDGHFFALVGWKSEDTGTVEGPHFMLEQDGVIITLDMQGKFYNVYSNQLRGWFPWTELKSTNGVK